MEELCKWLLKPRWYTKDKIKAEQSACQYTDCGNGIYSLGVLGAINAIATWTGVCVVVVDKSKIRLRKTWWDCTK